ncbi:phenylacetic acid degradation protein [Roseivivax isoporae LMG 25204]|uniref:Phenylacetic acid degradation protein n=1 Tax=Roseivivax isoporae LMG 25204 TaxID=1449351 RepID=X7FBU2_9RHOB|nr:phenylacetic acid degradation protein [Roseivivax isoporae LMG 25204]
MEARIRDSFARQTLMTTFGASIRSIAPGEVELEAPILPIARQQQGYGHAGLTFALGDTAAGYAALTRAPDGHEVLTSEIKINLLSPARGDRLIARGRVVKPGRRLIVVLSEVFAEDQGRETQIALLTGTMVPVAL